MTLLNLLNTFSLSLSAPIGADNHDFIDNNESIIDDTETNNQNINLYSINADLDIQEPLRNVGISDGANGGYVSDAIKDVDLENWLNVNYPDYCSLDGTWKRINSDSANTADLTSAIPLEINHKLPSVLPFNEGEIQQAIQNANVSDKTNYGGCGPIAIMGVMDYFARYLGFNFFNPNDSLSRIDLATHILKNTIFSKFGDVDDTFVWPGDVVKAFNNTLEELKCNNLRAISDFRLLSGNKNEFLKNIKKSIKNGIPVTLATGLRCGDGDFAEHYPNIYGYETWVGHSTDGHIKTKVFLKGRLNWGRPKEYFCDADILDCAQIGIMTYSFDRTYSMKADDFSS